MVDSDVLLSLISSVEPPELADRFRLHASRPHATSLAVAEVYAALSLGVAGLTAERRRNAFTSILETTMKRRILPFDMSCAETLARLSRTPVKGGSPPYTLAALIHAATAQRFELVLLTSRPEQYEGLGIGAAAVDLATFG
uniref:type II toxin-antitoxin system VapC family toxin n=1 Tax=Arthrobacter sp. H41 TaxID=1312978 RepID=UPI0031B7F0A5